MQSETTRNAMVYAKQHKPFLQPAPGNELRIRRVKHRTPFFLIFVITSFGIVVWLLASVLHPIWTALHCDLAKLERPEGEIAIIVDRNRKPLYTNGSRWLKLSDVNQFTVDALLASEDHRWSYRRLPFDAIGFVGAVVAHLHGGHRGGSTIEDELARSAFLSFDRTLSRKLAEAIIAARIAARLSKEEILEAYFNKVNFAGQAGLAAATQHFFAKQPKELDPMETAWLISTLPSPKRGKDRAHACHYADLVITKMKAQHLLPSDESIPRNYRFHWANEKASVPNSFPLAVREDVMRELKAHGMDSKNLSESNKEVEVTIDSELEEKIQSIVTTEGARLAQKLPALARGDFDIGVAIQDAHTGEILTAVGGRNPAQAFSCATQATRDLGSTVKPLIAAAALETGLFNFDSIVPDEPLQIGEINGAEGWHPKDYDGHFLGPIPLSLALVESRNLPWIRVGNACYSELAEITTKCGLGELAANHPAQFIGAFGATTLRLSAAYAMLANGGYAVQPHFIRAVTELKSGTVIYTPPSKPNGKPVIAQATATSVAKELERVVTDPRGTAHSLAQNNWSGGSVKTGTNGETDLRVCFFNTDVAIAIWAGRKSGKPLWPGAHSADLLPMSGDIIRTTRAILSSHKNATALAH